MELKEEANHYKFKSFENLSFEEKRFGHSFFWDYQNNPTIPWWAPSTSTSSFNNLKWPSTSTAKYNCENDQLQEIERTQQCFGNIDLLENIQNSSDSSNATSVEEPSIFPSSVFFSLEPDSNENLEIWKKPADVCSDESIIEKSKSRNYDSEPVISRQPVKPSSDNRDNYCAICMNAPRIGLIVHGWTAHNSVCYNCADKLFTMNFRCPDCNRKIEKILRLFP